VVLTGCFDEDKLPGVPLKLELTARKDYRPSRWTDGLHSFGKDTKFQVPAKIDVVFGNSGNHKSYLFFKKTKDKKEIRCEYKGGSSQSHPKGQKELDNARVYKFVKCDGGLKADDVAIAKDLRLRLDNGANEKESAYTIIKATILYAGAAPTPTPTVVATPRVTPTAVVTSTPNPSPTPDIFAGLPPDPGEAGRATVLGIDADRDGVRDDVQRWIQQTAPTSRPVRNALKQYASTAQKIHAAIGNEVEVLRLVQESSYASGCAMYVMDEIENRTDTLVVLNNLRAQNLNTHQRMKAEAEVSDAISGKLIRRAPISERGSFCKFNPNER
jgi:hypothetical protein